MISGRRRRRKRWLKLLLRLPWCDIWMSPGRLCTGSSVLFIWHSSTNNLWRLPRNRASSRRSSSWGSASYLLSEDENWCVSFELEKGPWSSPSNGSLEASRCGVRALGASIEHELAGFEVSTDWSYAAGRRSADTFAEVKLEKDLFGSTGSCAEQCGGPRGKWYVVTHQMLRQGRWDSRRQANDDLFWRKSVAPKVVAESELHGRPRGVGVVMDRKLHLAAHLDEHVLPEVGGPRLGLVVWAAGTVVDERLQPSRPCGPPEGASRAPMDLVAQNGTSMRKGEAPSIMTIAISREPPERMSSASPMHTVSCNSVDDFSAALRTVAGIRVSRQLPQSSMSTASMFF